MDLIFLNNCLTATCMLEMFEQRGSFRSQSHSLGTWIWKTSSVGDYIDWGMKFKSDTLIYSWEGFTFEAHFHVVQVLKKYFDCFWYRNNITKISESHPQQIWTRCGYIVKYKHE